MVEPGDVEAYPLLRPDRLAYLPTEFLLQSQADIAGLAFSADDQVSATFHTRANCLPSVLPPPAHSSRPLTSFPSSPTIHLTAG
jgi:hypothetical protein